MEVLLNYLLNGQPQLIRVLESHAFHGDRLPIVSAFENIRKSSLEGSITIRAFYPSQE
jgi:hypothetical protein